MPLVFSAITPHPPLLLPDVGKEQSALLDATKQAMLQLEQDLYIAKPQIIIVISPHTGRFEDAFCVNAHTGFEATYETFGDMTTKDSWKGTPDFAAKIQHRANMIEQIPVRLMSEQKLDYGAAVPLHFLTTHIKEQVKILPIGFSNMTAEQHVAFGEVLKEVIMESDKRVAIIASGDLSHCHTAEAPGGYHEDAETFDTQLIHLLESSHIDQIIHFDPAIVTNAQECVFRSLLILLGVVKNMNMRFQTYSYEKPHGVGYLVGNITF